jgi:three-Cys-motif partner protein
MGKTRDFFSKKKGWSVLKDEIIGCYLTPYINKILYTNRPLVIIDCFAGKGKFDDGNDGSPIIIGKHIKSVIDDVNRKNKVIYGIFIEKKYTEDLQRNLDGYRYCEVLKGKFDDYINKILNIDMDTNIFVYVDPYGIKNLNFKNFQRIKNKNFFSLELLMNLNSFGFLREGCRLLRYEDIQFAEQNDFDDEYEIDETNSIENMNMIADGDYWQEILLDKINEKIDMLQAEEKFINSYIQQLKKLFKYVVNIPIKLKTKNIPKYRLIFGTNHEDGLILMSDEMNKAWKKILQLDRKKQEVLFEYDFPDLTLYNGFNLEEDILDIIKKSTDKSILLKELIVQLIGKYGITFSQRDFKNKLKELNEKGLEIIWEPALTETGKKATSMDYRKYKIIVRSE